MTKVSFLKGTPEAIEYEKKQEASQPIAFGTKEPAEKVDDFVSSKVDIKPPLSAYDKITGKPYSVEYFKIDEWDNIDEDVPDVFDKKAKVKFVEDWVKERIKKLNLEDSIESYDEIMNQYKQELNISKTEKNESKLDRIYSYFKLLAKQAKLDKQRRELFGISK